jgi:hypothetical protein
MLERAWSTGVLTHVRRRWQQRGKGAGVGSGTRADAACAGDVMLGFHRLQWKHGTVVLCQSCHLMLVATVKVVGSQRAPGEILH